MPWSHVARMRSFYSWFQPSKYTKVADSSGPDPDLNDEKFEDPRHITRPRILPILVVVLLTGLLSGGLGFSVAQYRHGECVPAWADSLSRLSVGWVNEVFRYNGTFAMAPSIENTAVWNSILPKGRGWVRHPTIAPGSASITVFHQLHCLSDIRHAYYAGIGLSSEDPKLKVFQPIHLRHCFEYLRQGLMCSADSTLEPYDEKVDGATGWGVERLCRNYDELKTWAKDWRSIEFEGFVDRTANSSTSMDGHSVTNTG